ncbi:YkgJ family cysteine cluster protein [Polyangium aurulentum]|uniref:YkgJ family cysteine cluster protein n=1 Tax=Polyangium aurulentum TaxID=2567896 RepID=UPI0010ADCA8E|nr:YkgJ family cysteine cluster protein [Polyangium aurulentum]UQA58986.1 YkgJ family cysteine cluster protein [Polyangium aurulentum]
MSTAPPPSRPRLAEHAIVRRYRAREEDFWVIHDQRSGAAFRIGRREWGILAHADGTRDLDGILAAAARTGAVAREGSLKALIGALDGQGLLANGPAPAPSAPRPRAPGRPLDPLPGFSLACDGQGSCCRLYASVIFRPLEEARARVLLPLVLDAGEHPELAFPPMAGSAPCGASSVGADAGRCAYLEGDGRCGLHKRGGPEGKPFGCRTFPATFVDDGEAVRVAPAVECACVLASAVLPTGEGEPLVPAEARTSDDLDEAAAIHELPETLAISAERSADRADLVRWSRLVASSPPPADAARAAWSLAAAIEAEGLDLGAAERALAADTPIDLARLRPYFVALERRAAGRARVDVSWRSEGDLALRAGRWIRDAAKLLVDPSALASLVALGSDHASSEAFYLRVAVHGHHLVSGEQPLSHALRDRAARIVLARALPFVADEDDEDPALAHPLALVEAMIRGHGLSAYVHDVDAAREA